MRRLALLALSLAGVALGDHASALDTRAAWERPVPVPTFDRDFRRELPTGISVTRATSAWGYDSAGAVASFGSNVAIQPVFNSTGNQARGMAVWPTRTNVAHNSAWVANALTASVVNGTVYALSCTGNGTVSITNAATATVNCTGPDGGAIFTAGSITALLTRSDSSQSAQIETIGATQTVASGPIVTAAANVARNIDVINENISSVLGFTPSSGTLLVEFVPTSAAPTNVAARLVTISDGTESNRVSLFETTTGGMTGTVITGGISVNPATAGPVTAFTVNRAALTWNAGGAFVSLNGSAPSASGGAPTLAAAGVMTKINYGTTAVNTQACACYLLRIRYWPAGMRGRLSILTGGGV